MIRSRVGGVGGAVTFTAPRQSASTPPPVRHRRRGRENVEMHSSIILDYFARDIAPTSPVRHNLPNQLVREAQDAGDDHQSQDGKRSS